MLKFTLLSSTHGYHCTELYFLTLSKHQELIQILPENYDS